MRNELPEFRAWSNVAIRLLQGVVEAEDIRSWNLLLSNVHALEDYFARLGLCLIINEAEGLAYLRQLTEEEATEGYDALPKLFRSTHLSYGQTLLCVLLRDEFRRFEDEDTRNERCVIEESQLLDRWKPFFLPQGDDVKQSRELHATLTKLEDLGFVKRFGEDPLSWEVRRILKARITADALENLHRQLITAADCREKDGVDIHPGS